MSVRCTDKDGLNDETARKGFTLLEKYAESGIIPEKELDHELILFFYSEKLAFPVSARKDSLSWGMREISLQDLEIPYIIRELLKNNCDWKKAVREYFRRIGESHPEDFVEIVEELIKRRRKFLISGTEIVDLCKKYNRDGGVVIAELKGAGVISPHSGCGRAVSRLERIHGSPLYEINRFLIKLVEG
ncbi:hypothetical protein [Geoglobus acetivorans]|uniref:Uncharacterized protein n=1 Tax=Geoglobus acetivorans TaxID=565033 RepID=A0A0A7GIG9_GEOAI|nr:hypothetical protein GACE_1717 [Geoglobus acetivorans]